MDKEERLSPEEQRIKERMEEKRVDLTDKIETLESTLMETVQTTLHSATDVVENVTGSVQETVEAVKDTVQGSVEAVKDTVQESVDAVKRTFDFKHHVERHPWAMMAGAVAVGFLGGRLLGGRRRPAGAGREAGGAFPDLEPLSASATSAAPSREAEAEGSSPSWLSQLGSTFGPELSKLKGLALGAAFGVLRDLLTSSAPGQLRQQLADVVNDITTKLGGKPIQGHLIDTGAEGGAHDGRRGQSEADRPLSGSAL